MTIMPKSEWKKVELREISDIFYGKDYPTTQLKSEGYSVYGGNGVIGYSDKYLFEEPQVIIGCRGANSGNVFFTKPRSYVTHNSLILNIKPVIDKKFLFYRLFASHLKSTVTGSAQPQITIAELERLELSIPDSVAEQSRIAAILSTFDDKIEVNDKICENLEKTARAVFKEWFVDFRFPGSEKTDFVESQLGRIPKGWEVRKIADVAKLTKGLSYTSEEIKDRSVGVPMINLKCFIRGGGLRADGVKFYTGEYDPQHVVKPGQIVVALTDLTPSREVIGRPAVVPEIPSAKDIVISLDVCSIETSQSLRSYLYWLMSRPEFGKFMANSSSGTTVAHLSPRHIEAFEIVVPPKSLLEDFDHVTESTLTHVNTAHRENQSLSALRDTLLPKLMNGTVKV